MKTGGEFHQAESDVVISTKANCELTVNEKEDTVTPLHGMTMLMTQYDSNTAKKRK